MKWLITAIFFIYASLVTLMAHTLHDFIESTMVFLVAFFMGAVFFYPEDPHVKRILEMF